MNRRQMLCWTGGGAVFGLAGCLAEESQDWIAGLDDTEGADGEPTDSDPEDDPQPDEGGGGEELPDDPVAVVEGFFEALDAATSITRTRTFTRRARSSR